MNTYSTRNQSRSAIIPYFVLTVAIVALITPVLVGVLTNDIFGDYHTYMKFAWEFIETEQTTKPIPHFLFYQSLVLFYRIYPSGGMTVAAIVISLLYYILLGHIVFRIIHSQLPWHNPRTSALIAGIVTLSLIIIMPMSLFTANPPRWLYFAYIPITPFHNPTLLVLKPFAVLVFLLAVQIFEPHQNQKSIRKGIAAAILTALSIFAKPNFIIALLPALGLMSVFYLLYFKKALDWWIITGILITAIPLLGNQFLSTFDGTDSSIAIVPFTFFKQFEPVTWRLGAKFILSIAFPLAVTLLYWRTAFKDKAMILAWLVFSVGAFYVYFLSETGPRAQDGNFIWSGTITLFVLFVISVRFWFKNLNSHWKDWKLWICTIIFGAHVYSGILWMLANIRGQI